MGLWLTCCARCQQGVCFWFTHFCGVLGCGARSSLSAECIWSKSILHHISPIGPCCRQRAKPGALSFFGRPEHYRLSKLPPDMVRFSSFENLLCQVDFAWRAACPCTSNILQSEEPRAKSCAMGGAARCQHLAEKITLPWLHHHHSF